MGEVGWVCLIHRKSLQVFIDALLKHLYGRQRRFIQLGKKIREMKALNIFTCFSTKGPLFLFGKKNAFNMKPPCYVQIG